MKTPKKKRSVGRPRGQRDADVSTRSLAVSIGQALGWSARAASQAVAEAELGPGADEEGLAVHRESVRRSAQRRAKEWDGARVTARAHEDTGLCSDDRVDVATEQGATFGVAHPAWPLPEEFPALLCLCRDFPRAHWHCETCGAPLPRFVHAFSTFRDHDGALVDAIYACTTPCADQARAKRGLEEDEDFLSQMLRVFVAADQS